MMQRSLPAVWLRAMTNASRLHRIGLSSVLAALCLVLLQLQPAGAHMRGMYDTKAEAEKRAAELKCKGTFAMASMWMPCANERALHHALQKAQ